MASKSQVHPFMLRTESPGVLSIVGLHYDNPAQAEISLVTLLSLLHCDWQQIIIISSSESRSCWVSIMSLTSIILGYLFLLRHNHQFWISLRNTVMPPLANISMILYP